MTVDQSGPALETKEFDYRGTPLLRVIGQLDTHTGKQLTVAIESLIERGLDEIFLDLSPLEFIDSSGIGQLVKLHQELSVRGRKLILQWTPPNIIEILRTAGLDQILDIRPDPRKTPRGEVGLTTDRLLGKLLKSWAEPLQQYMSGLAVWAFRSGQRGLLGQAL